jgi:hypothetical protein
MPLLGQEATRHQAEPNGDPVTKALRGRRWPHGRA